MALDPIALSFFGINIYWYGLFYVFGFIFAYWMILHYCKDFGFKKNQIEDIFFWTMLLSVVGGRLFYVLFYNPAFFLQNPTEIIAVWNGGMSIHGGFIGGFLSLWYFSKKFKLSLLKLTDLFVLPAGLGLAFGRFANYINQELVGVVTTSPWGVIFPLYDDQTRWPYQLFAGFKNLIVFHITYTLFIFKQLRAGVLTALFLILYNLGRFALDFLREPTVSLGFISMGQLLCLAFAAWGAGILISIYAQSE